MPRSSPSTEQVRRFVAGLVIVVALGIAAALALPLPGQKTDAVLVDDAAGLMDEEQRARVAEYHGFLLEDHDIDYRVVTLEDSGDISLFAVERFEELGVGQFSQTGRGLMLVIDSGRDEVRLEVGYALEGAFPDAFVAYIEERQMVPFFGARRVADGILAASELIIARAQRAKQHAGLESEPAMTGSGGGGATAGAGLGTGPSE
ncbi:unnamed protein product, partial [marine sediment metagenome]